LGGEKFLGEKANIICIKQIYGFENTGFKAAQLLGDLFEKET